MAFEDLQKTKIDGLYFIPKKVIGDARGKVFHMLRADAPYYDGQFGEIYFSSVHANVVKGWKRHKVMQQRFSVPVGKIRFCFYDNREHSPTHGHMEEMTVGEDNHGLILVPPMLWYSFGGEAQPQSLIVNCSSICHDPNESENIPLELFSLAPSHWENWSRNSI